MPPHHITIVSPIGIKDPNDAYILQELCKKNNTQLLVLNQVSELYPLLSDPKFNTDCIGFDSEALAGANGLGLWDTINTITNILKSTTYKAGNREEKRNTIFSLGVSSNTDPAIIKEFLSVNERCVSIWPRGKEFDLASKEMAFLAAINKTKHIPKVMKKPKNKKTKAVLLTPRQSQIFSIIVTRGCSNKTIAKMLNISESTVKLHMGAILKKYGAKNRTQLVAFSNNKLLTI